MKHLILCSTLAVLTATTGFAKDKDDKKKDKDKDKKDKNRTEYVERDGRRYYSDRDDGRYSYDRDDDRRYSYGRDRTRSLYFIERNRPVQRVVYVDSNNRYYRYIDGRRVYVSGRYYESYPSRYYYSDGRPRVTITLPF